VNDVTERQPVDRRSACPGLFRLAPALDGGICRVKLSCGRLTADQAEAVAAAAQRFSAADIELTNRANLQIRAVQAKDEEALIAALLAAGLGPQPRAELAACDLDDAVLLGSDDVRNVMVSPLAGRDPAQIVDALPLAQQVLASLQGDRRYHALSPKFAIQIDAGESVAMLNHPHDVWLAVISADEVAIGLNSCMPVAGDRATPGQDMALAAAPIAQAHAVICAVLDLFLDLAHDLPGVSRMKQLPPERSGVAFIDRLQARLAFALRRDPGVSAWRRATVPRGSHIGVIAERDPASVSIGGAPVLGRLHPASLAAIAALARSQGDGSLLLTPWQSVLLPKVPRAKVPAVLRGLAAAGLQVEAGRPQVQAIACTGAQGCGSGLAATQADGARLIELLAARKTAFPVHLTGCSKSCAAMRAEPATLLATAPGIYDLYRRDASAGSRFGRLVARDITIEEACGLLADAAAEPGAQA
jgi:precorrin-3B synthase